MAEWQTRQSSKSNRARERMKVDKGSTSKPKKKNSRKEDVS
jgi:hypothetical protein